MPRSPLELIWQGGEHPFYLGISELRALQEKCDAGPAFIKMRLEKELWFVDDIVQPIRLGLIGGGMDNAQAASLVKKHVEGEYLTQSVVLALAIMMSVLYNPEGDAVGEFNRRSAKEAAGIGHQSRSREVKFVSVISTESA